MQPGHLRLDRIVKQYDGVAEPAVRDLSLTVEQGEFITLLGPSGSGKTTTLNIVAGFVAPTTGTVSIGGRDVTDLPTQHRNLSMVFQSYALFPHLSVFENVAFPLRIRRVAADAVRRQVAAMLEMVQLEAFAQRKPAQLSGGQQQRVALARAFAFDPAVLLMDEPLGALDKKLREQMQIEIKRIQRHFGMTVIYVTHDQGEALTMSDRVAVMNHGAIVQLAPPRRLYDEPDSAFVADFVGETNLIDARSVGPAAGDRIAVTLLGETLVGRPRGALRPAAAVTASVRPERVEIVDPDALLAAGGNRLAGTVEDLIYFGDEMKCRVRVAPGLVITAKMAIQQVRAVPSAGQRVGLAWAPDHMHVFPSA